VSNYFDIRGILSTSLEDISKGKVQQLMDNCNIQQEDGSKSHIVYQIMKISSGTSEI